MRVRLGALLLGAVARLPQKGVDACSRLEGVKRRRCAPAPPRAAEVFDAQSHPPLVQVGVEKRRRRAAVHMHLQEGVRLLRKRKERQVAAQKKPCGGLEETRPAPTKTTDRCAKRNRAGAIAGGASGSVSRLDAASSYVGRCSRLLTPTPVTRRRSHRLVARRQLIPPVEPRPRREQLPPLLR